MYVCCVYDRRKFTSVTKVTNINFFFFKSTSNLFVFSSFTSSFFSFSLFSLFFSSSSSFSHSSSSHYNVKLHKPNTSNINQILRENIEEKCKNQAFGMEKHHCSSRSHYSWVKILSSSLLLEGDPLSCRCCTWSKHCFCHHIAVSFTAYAQNGRVSTFREKKGRTT